MNGAISTKELQCQQTTVATSLKVNQVPQKSEYYAVNRKWRRKRVLMSVDKENLIISRAQTYDVSSQKSSGGEIVTAPRPPVWIMNTRLLLCTHLKPLRICWLISAIGWGEWQKRVTPLCPWKSCPDLFPFSCRFYLWEKWWKQEFVEKRRVTAVLLNRSQIYWMFMHKHT